jgi:hypothetical protein
MVVVLFGVGLVTFPSLGHAFVAPAALLGLTTLEGHFITPTIVGRRITLNPLVVVLALAFWTWMWGPIGAFLAMPLSIVGLVVVGHLFPTDEVPTEMELFRPLNAYPGNSGSLGTENSHDHVYGIATRARCNERNRERYTRRPARSRQGRLRGVERHSEGSAGAAR